MNNDAYRPLKTFSPLMKEALNDEYAKYLSGDHFIHIDDRTKLNAYIRFDPTDMQMLEIVESFNKAQVKNFFIYKKFPDLIFVQDFTIAEAYRDKPFDLPSKALVKEVNDQLNAHLRR